MSVEEQPPNFPDNLLDWLHEGYPQGVPPTDYFPLLALLLRTLTEEELIKATRSILVSGDCDTPVTEERIRQAIKTVIEKEPNPQEMNQVATRLASVGWPVEDFAAGS